MMIRVNLMHREDAALYDWNCFERDREKDDLVSHAASGRS